MGKDCAFALRGAVFIAACDSISALVKDSWGCCDITDSGVKFSGPRTQEKAFGDHVHRDMLAFVRSCGKTNGL